MTTITRNAAIAELCSHRLATLSQKERQDFLADYWTICTSDPDYLKLPRELQSKLQTNEPPTNAADRLYDPIIMLALRDQWRGVINDYITIDLNRIGKDVLVKGEVEFLHPCPCCSYNTLVNLRQLDVCRVCLWEDDGTESLHKFSPVNHTTLADARACFNRIGVCAEHLLTKVDSEAKHKFHRFET